MGLGAESALKVPWKNDKISQRCAMNFWMDCMQSMATMMKKIFDISPLKFKLGHPLNCLDPELMLKDADLCMKKMKFIVQKLIHAKQLQGGLSAGVTICQQFISLLEDAARDEQFTEFQKPQRIETFLLEKMSSYRELRNFVNSLLIYSHGQAHVEGGFSVNKEVEQGNLYEETVIAHRLICDFVASHGGVVKVPIMNDCFNFGASARSRHVAAREEEIEEEEGREGKKLQA